MQYFTTFDGVFAFFVFLTIVGTAIAFVGSYVAKKKNQTEQWNQYMQKQSYWVTGFWIIMLLIGGINSLAGTTTFLFASTILGIVLGVIAHFRYSQSFVAQELKKEYFLMPEDVK